MRKTKTFNLDIYNCKIVMIITDDTIEEEHKLRQKYEGTNGDDEDTDGFCLNFSNATYHIIFKHEAISHNLIAHECLHLTKAITEDRHIEDEESQAWLMGYVCSLIYEALDKEKIKIKHGH